MKRAMTIHRLKLQNKTSDVSEGHHTTFLIHANNLLNDVHFILTIKFVR